MIVEAGWHPFLRINQQGLVKISSHGQWQPLDALVSAPGQSWSGQVVCFKTNPLACTLLARWDSGYQEPWLVLTDLSPQRADALWYGLRPSTECVYRDLKSEAVNISGEYFYPQGNFSTINNIDLGQQRYQITGQIRCQTIGNCQVYGEGVINVIPNNTYYVIWRNTSIGQCTAHLQ